MKYMKLFLTSTGLETKEIAESFVSFLAPVNPQNLSFLIVTIQDSESDAFYLAKTLAEIKNIGAQDIDVFKLAGEQFISSKEYDVIVVCGGNTFDYLDRIRKTGLDKFIVDFSKKDQAVYIGISAGSIVAGPDIEIAGWGSNSDENNIGLVDLTGLKLVDFVVYPHYQVGLQEEVAAFKKKVDYQVIEIEDGQVVTVNN